MKKIIFALTVYSILFTAFFTVKAVNAGDTVTVNQPVFDIAINGEKIATRDAKYPPIVYNDVTYLPISDKHSGNTYNYMNCLGIICGEDRSYSKYGKLFIRNMWFERDIPQNVVFEKTDSITSDMTAVVTEHSNVIVNRFGNIREIVLRDYPMLEIKGVKYLPMTYDIACSGLGLSMSFSSEKGLEIQKPGIPPRIVSVPQFEVVLSGVKYRNEIAKYPFFSYNNIVYMPLTEGICDFMGIKFRHLTADTDNYERLIVGNKTERNDNADFDYIKEGDVLSMALAEPFDGELYVNSWSTRWHTYGMEYPPMMLGEVYYIPLTWQIAHDHFGWEYFFSAKSGLVIDCGNTAKPEADF